MTTSSGCRPWVERNLWVGCAVCHCAKCLYKVFIYYPMECCWYHLLFLVGNVVLYNTGINTCFTLMGLLYCNLQTTADLFFLFFFSIDWSLSWEDLLQRKRKLVPYMSCTTEYDFFLLLYCFYLHLLSSFNCSWCSAGWCGIGFCKKFHQCHRKER